ncbi:solute carrier family 23 member 2-like [Pomacea canaliculata]|uniref:solute carrier family 23 member 2-like n=1 Tax=Pomacea canaliculata TaxID=400727 RepID=UPI000D73E599|nr:solute carrier family 23 member 2-like [Pomacea canaliculata]
MDGKEDKAVLKEEVEESIEIEEEQRKRLIYRTGDLPPVRLLALFTLQQGLLGVAGSLSVSILVAEVICARDDQQIKTQILSATFFMIGISTFCMSTFGIRLPIFQGAASTYIIPLFALTNLPEWKCPSHEDLVKIYNTSMTLAGKGTLATPHDIIFPKLQLISGSLMAAGGVHFLIGVTGLVGFLLKFIGPITMVVAITLVGLYVYKVAVRFCETFWAVAILTAACGIVLSLYLAKTSTPIPAWNKKRGFYIKWYPLHQVFAILISVVIGWTVSAILTHADVISSDQNGVGIYARTDTHIDVIASTDWFSLPYPGRFGFPSFHAGVFVSFMIATLMSILDSICDYNACARMCYVPRPPDWAVNRGIAVEGIMSMLSGGMGVGHATVSYGGNIGAIGLTRVASRGVFQCVGLLYIVLAVTSKLGAIFVTIPHSVLGGCQIITIGIFIGIVLSNLQYVDLSSTRNVAIIGISLLLGLMVPHWVETNPDGIKTGSEQVDRLLQILAANPSFVGGVLACFLDNTVPGTPEERGVSSNTKKDTTTVLEEFEEGLEVYRLPWVPEFIQKSWLARFIQIIPGPSQEDAKKEDQVLPHHIDLKDT